MDNVEILSSAAYTPAVCLHDVMTRMREAKVEKVVVMIQTDDGAVETFLSSMPISAVAYLAKCLDRRVYNLIEGSADK